MAKVRMIPLGLKEFEESDDVVGLFSDLASDFAARAGDVPSHLQLVTRAGHGPRGAYGQVILRGPGAGTWEFGSSTHRPHGTLRRLLGGR